MEDSKNPTQKNVYKYVYIKTGQNMQTYKLVYVRMYVHIYKLIVNIV